MLTNAQQAKDLLLIYQHIIIIYLKSIEGQKKGTITCRKSRHNFKQNYTSKRGKSLAHLPLETRLHVLFIHQMPSEPVRDRKAFCRLDGIEPAKPCPRLHVQKTLPNQLLLALYDASKLEQAKTSLLTQNDLGSLQSLLLKANDVNNTRANLACLVTPSKSVQKLSFTTVRKTFRKHPPNIRARVRFGRGNKYTQWGLICWQDLVDNTCSWRRTLA